MAKYLGKRLLHGAISVVIVVGIVMLMVYSLLDRNLVFAADGLYTKKQNNEKEVYKYRQWEKFGYVDMVSYAEYLAMLVEEGEMTAEESEACAAIGRTPEKDSPEAAEGVKKFEEYCAENGYEYVRLDAVVNGKKVLKEGGEQQLFGYKNLSVFDRLWTYFGSIIEFDTIHYVDDSVDIGERGLTFTLYDPVYGGKKFSPAIIGNGTEHKYLLYFDNKFPFVHQNLVSIHLGVSYSVETGVDVATSMSKTQGSYVSSSTVYPSGAIEVGSDDLHTATFAAGSYQSNELYQRLFTDDYTNTITVKAGKSKLGYSFIIGILSVILSYLLGLPLGVIMAQKKDKLVDQLGSVYIVFIIAVPSLAYIFLFKAIGGKIGLPTTFDSDGKGWLYYVLPVISLSLPSIASLMKWLRRYMIDQMNSDYVKFARSGGLTEGEIFRKHILKNAIIPVVHGIPGSVLFAMTGAIITERVYVVPGAGNLLTRAINTYDNGVIVGVTLFYTALSVVSILLGDVLMSVIDPRISFDTKAR